VWTEIFGAEAIEALPAEERAMKMASFEEQIRKDYQDVFAKPTGLLPF
jgi:hypothetical protein